MNQHDNLITLISSYGDHWQAYYAAAEIAYYEEHGKLPEWACIIERIEDVGGNLLYIHHDRKQDN